jgi:hypothetical protein
MTFMQKVSLYIRMVYGLLSVFIVVGFMAGKQQAVFFAIILTVCYTLMRIIDEALTSWQILRAAKLLEKSSDE